MKFSAVAVALSLVASAEAFAPLASVSQRLTLSSDARQATSSELNLFGMNTLKAKKFNAPAKAQDTVSEGEVRGEYLLKSRMLYLHRDAAEPSLHPPNQFLTTYPALFELWNDALATGDSRIVASRYTKSPVLLATVSDTPRTDFASVKDYFDSFLLKEPQGKILDGNIKISENGEFASDTGIYEVRPFIDIDF